MGDPGRRDEASTEVLLDALVVSGGRALVCDDDTARVSFAVTARGASVAEWKRRGPDGRPWPPPGEFDLAILRLPREKAFFDLALHALASRLVPGGALYVYGANDEGIRSAADRVGALFTAVETVDARRHCRVLRAERPPTVPCLVDSLAGWRAESVIELPSGPRPWVSYPGTFARGGLDPATAALLNRMPTSTENVRALDFACGTGVIAAEVAARGCSRLDMADHDALALEAARANVPAARGFLGDGWSAVPEGDYDLVLSNPPIHEGVERSYDVLGELLARRSLARGGELWLVTQRQAPVARLAPDARLDWEDGRFCVWVLSPAPAPSTRRPTGTPARP